MRSKYFSYLLPPEICWDVTCGSSAVDVNHSSFTLYNILKFWIKAHMRSTSSEDIHSPLVFGQNLLLELLYNSYLIMCNFSQIVIVTAGSIEKYTVFLRRIFVLWQFDCCHLRKKQVCLRKLKMTVIPQLTYNSSLTLNNMKLINREKHYTERDLSKSWLHKRKNICRYLCIHLCIIFINHSMVTKAMATGLRIPYGR